LGVVGKLPVLPQYEQFLHCETKLLQISFPVGRRILISFIAPNLVEGVAVAYHHDIVCLVPRLRFSFFVKPENNEPASPKKPIAVMAPTGSTFIKIRKHLKLLMTQ
jgi:hypothetical protein